MARVTLAIVASWARYAEAERKELRVRVDSLERRCHALEERLAGLARRFEDMDEGDAWKRGMA